MLISSTKNNPSLNPRFTLENDRNPNFHYLPKPNILHFQMAEYSAETEHSAEYLIFC